MELSQRKAPHFQGNKAIERRPVGVNDEIYVFNNLLLDQHKLVIAWFLFIRIPA